MMKKTEEKAAKHNKTTYHIPYHKYVDETRKQVKVRIIQRKGISPRTGI